MKKEIQMKCIICCGTLLPNAKFCHYCGEKVLSKPFPKRAPKRVEKVNAGWRIIAILVVAAVTLGMLNLIHSRSQMQSRGVPPIQTQWPILLSWGGDGDGSVALSMGMTPAPITYQPLVESVAPELTLSQTMSGWDWMRGEDDLPRAVVEVGYSIKNEGTGSAKDVNLTLKNMEETRSWKISYISPGQEYRDSFTISTSPVWRNIDGIAFLTGFEAQAELIAECGGHEVRDYLSVSFPRGLIESDERYAPYLSPYLVTPDDPIVKSTLENVLAEKDWYDIRTVEAYLHDWVGGGITGLGITGGVRYDFEKIDVDAWFKKHKFWSQFPRETIQYGKGVCIDQAILYATFLRAYGYGPDDVYVICGIPLRKVQEALHETLGLDVAGHAWVVYKKEILGYEHWVLVETTQGGISRVTTPIELFWDAIAMALGQEGMQFYEGYYAFNDMRFREIKSMNTSQDSVSSTAIVGLDESLIAFKLWDLSNSFPIVTIPIGSTPLTLTASVEVTVHDPSLDLELGSIMVNSGYVSITPKANVGIADLPVEVVSARGGLALVVYDPTVKISITQDGITYAMSFKKLYAGTWQAAIEVFGVTVATIQVPEYGVTLEGKEISGTILGLPEIGMEEILKWMGHFDIDDDDLAFGSRSNEDGANLLNRVQATVDSFRVLNLSKAQMEQNDDYLLDYYVDYTNLLQDPLTSGVENPVNLLIFVRTETKDDSRRAILSMFKQFGYFESSNRLEFLSKMYPTDREIELYRDFSVEESSQSSLLPDLQFHARGMYVHNTELGHLWAICGHVEYSVWRPIDHIYHQITHEMAGASESVTWPYVKWESFEEDVKLQLLEKLSDEPLEMDILVPKSSRPSPVSLIDYPSNEAIQQDEVSLDVKASYNVSYVGDINYGNSGHYEGNDDFYFNDGTLRAVILIEEVI